MRWLLVFGLLAITATTFAQLINIEARRINPDTTKAALNVGINGNYSDNDGTKLLLMSTNLLGILKSRDLKNTWLFLGNFELYRSGDQQFANSWFGHIRYIRQFKSRIHGEALIQLLNNSLLHIDLRNLVGAGPRFQLVNSKALILNLGTTYLHEWEKSLKYDSYTQANRLSTYVSCVIKWAKLPLQFTQTAYYQPNLVQWQDYRFLDETQLTLEASKHVNVVSTLRYYFDRAAPDGGHQHTFNTTFGIVLKF